MSNNDSIKEVLVKTEFFAFGEILWDCLPSGRHAGGAPFNVCAHLAQLGVSAALISTVGEDPLGDELLQVAKDKGVETKFITRAALPTGTVIATLNAQGNASYEIVKPVAWDEIAAAPALDAVTAARALIFGSLAGRSAYNLDQLRRLLAVKGPLKCFDVNLRPPFTDPTLIVQLARQADLIKLNHEECAQLAAWFSNRQPAMRLSTESEAIEQDCAAIANATSAARICVTRAEAGASLWDHGRFISVSAPAVTVKDTVGAGDSFMAALVVGLTQGIEAETVLRIACRVGAFVASHDGATPLLPADLISEIRDVFRLASEQHS